MERLAEQTEIDDLVIRRWTAATVVELHEAIQANVDHLRDRMAWIAHEPVTLHDRAALVARWQQEWEGGGEATYGVWREGAVVAAGGLHARIGPGGLEIGYWVDGRCQGQGIATRLSRALTDVAFLVPEIDRVEIAHDVTNLASGRVPEKLGFTRVADRLAPTRDLAPADTGTDAAWRITRAEWMAKRA